MSNTNRQQGFIVVLGGGESGVGAAILAQKQGYDVLLSDNGIISDKYRTALEQRGVPFEQGGHSVERILTATEIIKSPGIPLTAPLIVEAMQRGIPVISEIEFAGRYSRGKMVCITGSNGKTTTTMLTHHILTDAGMDAGLAGNVGNSLALQVADGDHDVYVVELSSFQLDNMYDFKADVAILLNITPDHLDRYDHNIDNYAEAKMRVMRNQSSSDAFIYWADDPMILRHLEGKHPTGTVYRFTDRDDRSCAARLDQDDVMHINAGGLEWSMPAAELALRGKHNLYNSMSAAIAATLMGVEVQQIKHSLGTFRSVEHRLEPVRELDGVQWINDSKATNVNSTFYALGSMTRPTVLILGGKDKGNDYSEIADLVKEKVTAIVCLGVDNRKLHAFFDGMVATVVDADSMSCAVNLCHSLARPGMTVLLSPCCASFDLFKSYEDRGRQFKECVNALRGNNDKL